MNPWIPTTPSLATGSPNLDDPIMIYKDLDLKSTVKLGTDWHERLMFQISADCALLESCDVRGEGWG
jgi:hypothetical protein